MSPVTFDTYTEAKEFIDANGGSIKHGKHYGVGIYDFIAIPSGQEDEVLSNEEYQAVIDRLCADGKLIPSYEFAFDIVAATARCRAAIKKAEDRPKEAA